MLFKLGILKTFAKCHRKTSVLNLLTTLFNNDPNTGVFT